MGHRPLLPPELLRGPFTIDDAQRVGLSRRHLEGASWTRIGPSIYVSSALRHDPVHRLTATLLRLPPGAAFSGFTAAWLHGLDVAPCDPIEVTVPDAARVSARSGVVVRRSIFGRDDVVQVRGMPATSVVRTLGEVCGRIDLVEAVVVADAALHQRRATLDQLTSWAETNAGRRGVRRFRHVLGYVEPSTESPMESRLRMVLVLGGLPRPRAQVPIRDRWGRVIGRPDLYYEQARLGIEYDGGIHREMLAEDNRRQNKLLNAGVRLLRFTAADVMGNPHWVVTQVRSMLKGASAGSGSLEEVAKGASAGARG